MKDINKQLSEGLKWIVKKWDKIPDEFKVNLRKNASKIKDVKTEGHLVVLLVNRQKPSIEADYTFDEERFGINRFGEIVWGFDSGCSCPIPWGDSFPKCYSAVKTWKEFIVVNKGKTEIKGYSDFFDIGWKEEALQKIKLIKEVMKKTKQKVILR